MGRMQADEFGGLVQAGEIALELALGWHLQSNHYPPVPSEMVEPCKKAIELANAGEWDEMVDLPEGVEYRDGSTMVTAAVLIESFHLDSFLDEEALYE